MAALPPRCATVGAVPADADHADAEPRQPHGHHPRGVLQPQLRAGQPGHGAAHGAHHQDAEVRGRAGRRGPPPPTLPCHPHPAAIAGSPGFPSPAPVSPPPAPPQVQGEAVAVRGPPAVPLRAGRPHHRPDGDQQRALRQAAGLHHPAPPARLPRQNRYRGGGHPSTHGCREGGPFAASIAQAASFNPYPL